VQGQITSHEQVSKYEPLIFQAMSPPRDAWDRGRVSTTAPGGSTSDGTRALGTLLAL
jgi:hypothetical protein